MASRDSVSAMEDFISRGGLDGFPHIADPDGEIWSRFPNATRSSFIFVNNDGSFERTGYGQMNEERMRAQVDRLLAS